MLLKTFNIDTEKVNERNKQLINLNLMDRLSSKQKKLLNFYKGPPKFINEDGLYSYSDITTYLTDEESFSKINVKKLKDFIIIYQINREKSGIKYDEIVDQLDNILKTIQKKRINSVIKYIKIFDTIFTKGIQSTDTVYRMMSEPFTGNVIKNMTSWSLSPIEWFCNSEKSECHLYVTKLSKKIKVMYVENESKDKNLKTFQEFKMYEFEYLLPRDIEFKELKTKKIVMPNHRFAAKNSKNKKKEIKIIIHYIKLIKKLKSKNEDLVKNIPISLITQQ